MNQALPRLCSDLRSNLQRHVGGHNIDDDGSKCLFRTCGPCLSMLSNFHLYKKLVLFSPHITYCEDKPWRD